MSNKDKIFVSDLFSEIPTLLRPFFENVTYPWEIVPEIKSIIARLIKTGLLGYTEIRDGVFVGKNVKISPSAEIIPPTIIGDNTEIRHGAFLRGNVIIGCECVIGNSTEIKNSILFDRVAAPHYNYIGDSILGCGAHMGAGAIASNLKSDKSLITVKGKARYETGLKKLGAILGDRAEIGCGCVMNPGTVVGRYTSIYPLTSVRGIIPPDRIVKNTREIMEKQPQSR